MSYSNKITTTWTLPEQDFGDGATVDTYSFRGPPGKEGKVIKVGCAITETFACDNTPAKLRVGNASDPDKFAELQIADAAAADDAFDETDDPDAIKSAAIAADELVEVTGVVGVDAATEAGKGVVYVTCEWW